MPVLRERLEKACVTTRVAETFIRIGNFEHFLLHSPRFSSVADSSMPTTRFSGIIREWAVMRVPKLDNVNLDASDA
ncbi:hypothetical protein EDD15DRAFT_2268969 [Pisolithus albus]|nr:hypothetical protein EDD15DRAFT_2268969 [Pisolithus albus]